MKHITPSLLTLILIFSLLSCNTINKKKVSTKNEPMKSETINTTENNTTTNQSLSVMPGPPIIVYKTKKDYTKLVAITMNEDKTEIVSFPDPKDVFYKGQLAYPTKLVKGYLLDNRGISTNTVFINISYEEYSKLTKAPSVKELMNMIVDKNPFIKMYDLGIRKNNAEEIQMINEILSSESIKARREWSFD